MNFLDHVIVRCRRWSGLDIDDEMRRVFVASLGQVDLIADPSLASLELATLECLEANRDRQGDLALGRSEGRLESRQVTIRVEADDARFGNLAQGGPPRAVLENKHLTQWATGQQLGVSVDSRQEELALDEQPQAASAATLANLVAIQALAMVVVVVVLGVPLVENRVAHALHPYIDAAVGIVLRLKAWAVMLTSHKRLLLVLQP